MNEEELFCKLFPEYAVNGKPLHPYFDLFESGYEQAENRIEGLESQIEKLIDFVLLKTECCDVCPIDDTCINDEGTCPYAGILSKGEEAVTREWLMQKITKEIKENEIARRML